MVETARGHALAALAVRTQESHFEQHGRSGHGGHLHRTDRGPGAGQYDQQRGVALGEEGQAEGGVAEEASASASEEAPRAADY